VKSPPEAEAVRPAVPARKQTAAKKRVVPAPPAEKPVPKAVPAPVETKKIAAKKAVAAPAEVPPAPTTPSKATKVKTVKTEKAPVLAQEKAQPKTVKERVETPILKPKPRVAKKAAPRRKVDTRITVYVARGGPARGEADYEQAFANRHQALAFLSNQHGLSGEEQRQLAKASRLKLNRRWHGSEACALREIALEPDQAAKVLRGEMASA
jgi:hypothetical protein